MRGERAHPRRLGDGGHWLMLLCVESAISGACLDQYTMKFGRQFELKL
jgi:hypothetical protein